MKKKDKGYVVVTKETGAEHEKKPIPKAKAEAQMRILESVMHKNKDFSKVRTHY